MKNTFQIFQPPLNGSFGGKFLKFKCDLKLIFLTYCEDFF